MNKGVKIKLNSAGVRELLQSKELMDCCEEIASGIADRADGKWDVNTGTGKYRAYASVSTSDKDTYFRNLRSNTLLKAMGGGES